LKNSIKFDKFLIVGNNIPNPGDKIVYIDGSFDVLHPGHLEALKQAKALGDFLIVGVHDDDIV